MGLTPEEFLRTLPAALGHGQYRVDNLSIRINDPRGEVKIDLHPLLVRVLGSLTLPVTRVELAFFGFSRRQTGDFMGRLGRYFQRGGG